MKTLERCQWRRLSAFIDDNCENMSNFVLIVDAE